MDAAVVVVGVRGDEGLLVLDYAAVLADGRGLGGSARMLFTLTAAQMNAALVATAKADLAAQFNVVFGGPDKVQVFGGAI